MGIYEKPQTVYIEEMQTFVDIFGSHKFKNNVKKKHLLVSLRDLVMAGGYNFDTIYLGKAEGSANIYVGVVVPPDEIERRKAELEAKSRIKKPKTKIIIPGGEDVEVN